MKEANNSSNMEEQGSGKVQQKVNYLKDVEDTIDTEAHLPHLPFDIVKLIAERLFSWLFALSLYVPVKRSVQQ